MKKEKGSITLYVLIACIFFVVILSIVYTNVVHKKQTQEENIAQIQANYAKNLSTTITEESDLSEIIAKIKELEQSNNQMSQQIEQQEQTITTLSSEVQTQQQTIASLNSDLSSRGTYKWSNKLLKTNLELYSNNICELSIEKGYWLILFSVTLIQSDEKNNYSYQPTISVGNCTYYSGDGNGVDNGVDGKYGIFGTNAGKTNDDNTAEMSMCRFVEVNSTTTVYGGAWVDQPNTTVRSAKITAIKIR